MALNDILFKLIRRIQSVINGETGIMYGVIVVFALYWMFNIVKRKSAGRLLKRIFVIDILLGAFILISVFLVYRISIRKTSSVFLILTYQREFEREFPVPPEYWAVDKIRPGDISYNSLGKKTAEVIEVTKSYWGADRENFSVLVKVEATLNDKTGELILDGKPLLVGSKISMPLGKTQFNSIVTNLFFNQEDRVKGYRRAKAVVRLKGRFYEPWQAESLRDFKVIDSNGGIAVETKSIVIEPSEYAFTTNNGTPLRLKDPIKKDVTIVLALNDVFCAERTCYIDETKPLKIGHNLWLTSDKTVLPGANIMDFEIEYIDK